MTSRLDLRSALFLYLLLPVVVAMSLATVVAVQGLEQQMERRMQEDLELVARALQRPLARSLERGRLGSVQEALDSAFRINRVFGAYVYDMKGETVAVAGSAESLPRRRRLSELAREGERKGEYGEVAGRDVYSYFVPLSDSNGQIPALLHVTRRAEDFETYFVKLRWQAGGFLVGSWIAVAVLILAGHRRVAGRPLDVLLESIDRIGAGDHSHRAVEQGPRELAGLARHLNQMLDGIARAQEEISRRRERQTELEDELRHSERLAGLGRLALGVAHELGTPLSVISGRVQRGRRRLTAGSALHETLDEVAGQVRRMDTVVRQLLEFGSRGDVELEETRVADVCRTAVRAVEDLAAEEHREIGLRCPPEDLVLKVGSGRLERVLINLLRNAIQAPESTRVMLGWRLAGSRIELTIDDDGRGVPREIRRAIFDPFFTTKAVDEGSGLGLAVVHGLVQECGGEVRVGDGPLGGARFTVSLERILSGEEIT